MTERLAKFADHLAQYGAEQAIIYAYGLPDGGMVERHQMLISDIRSVLGASSRSLSVPQEDQSKLGKLMRHPVCTDCGTQYGAFHGVDCGHPGSWQESPVLKAHSPSCASPAEQSALPREEPHQGSTP